MSKEIELLKKLSELSKRGVDGEKLNAELLLKKLLKKHNLTMEDIEGEKKLHREFKVSKEKELFFLQVTASVLGVFSYWDGLRKGEIILNVTDSEFIEIDTKYHFYWKEYQSERQIFYEAFIQRNHLYKKTDDSQPIQQKDLSQKEKERVLRVLAMASNIDNKTLHKQLSK